MRGRGAGKMLSPPPFFSPQKFLFCKEPHFLQGSIRFYKILQGWFCKVLQDSPRFCKAPPPHREIFVIPEPFSRHSEDSLLPPPITPFVSLIARSFFPPLPRLLLFPVIAMTAWGFRLFSPLPWLLHLSSMKELCKPLY